LWLVVSFLLLAVFTLLRQVGLLHRRLAPVGARMARDGPPVGSPAPELAAADLAGQPVELAAARSKLTLLVFVLPGCSACGELMSAVRSLARSERKQLEIVVISGAGDEAKDREFVRAHKLTGISYLASKELGERYQITQPPYAVLVGADGLVKAKGLVNHLEHLESLLTAARLGHPSMESYLEAERVAPETPGIRRLAGRRSSATV
jgi:methylamine dehydrogenase accessory protein MauD